MSIVSDYVAGVKSGKVPANYYVKQAARRHELDLLRDDIFYDEETEAEVLDFARLFFHYQGPLAGQPFEPDPFQAFIICSCLCWVRRSDGLRRYRYAYVEIPRKNAKTFLAAVVAGYMLSLDGEGGAEVYSCATQKAQASKVWGDFYKMTKRSPALSSKFIKHWDHIAFTPTDSLFQPLTANSENLDGLNPHCAINDELHAWKSRDLYDVVEDGMGARVQPFVFNITTAGDNLEGICYEVRAHAVNVVEAIDRPEDYSDDTFFVFVATVDEEELKVKDYWKDPRIWAMANPALGTAKRLDYMEEQVKKAEHMPGKLNTLLRKQFDIWTLGDGQGIDVEKWLDEVNIESDETKLHGLYCHGGLDLAATVDVAGYCWLFPIQPGLEKMTVLFRFFVPLNTIEKRYKHDRVPYPKWFAAGHLLECGEDAIDNNVLFDKIYADASLFEIRCFGFDPWNANDLVRRLLENSFDMVRMRQGFPTLASPTKDLETRVIAGRVNCLRNPVMNWMVRNAVFIEDDNGNKRPSKKKSREKIDGVFMLVMALGRYLSTVDPENDPEIYGDEDLIIV
tara:strand:+ start:552 stop:2246 length:1695 start_codon:yes stop_codon:yes gene_type:complete